MAKIDSWLSGAAGAGAMTLTHEILRQLVPASPRLDKMGMNILARALRRTAGRGSVPDRERLRAATLAADLLVNAVYFASLAGRPRTTVTRGALAGVAAGVASVLATPLLGVPSRHQGAKVRGPLLTIGLYALGGGVSAALRGVLRRRERALPAVP